MVKAINAWAFGEGRTPEEMFRIAREAGFGAVELTIAEEGPVSTALTREECLKIREQADKADVLIASLASGLGWANPITADDPEVRRRGIDLTARSLEVANWLGTDALLMVPGGVFAGFIPGFLRVSYGLAYERALFALEELREVAESTGVRIGVENVWNMFLLSPLEMRDFIDRIGSPWVGSYFDVGNVVASGFPEDWIHILGSRIVRVHFKDFKREVGTLDGFCGLLEGDVDYPAVIRALKEVGYDGFVTAEFFDCEGDLRDISEAMDRILEAQ